MTDTTPKPCPLLVLFHAIERERANGRHAVADEFQAAHDALAELIEAASRAAIAAVRGDENRPGTIRNTDLDRLRAALARFTLPA